MFITNYQSFIYHVQVKTDDFLGKKSLLDTPKRMIERRERGGEKEREC